MDLWEVLDFDFISFTSFIHQQIRVTFCVLGPVIITMESEMKMIIPEQNKHKGARQTIGNSKE